MKKFYIFFLVFIIIFSTSIKTNRYATPDEMTKVVSYYKDPLTDYFYINIEKKYIKMIEITISAKHSDAVHYTIYENNIKKYKKGVLIPIQYLVADKLSNIDIITILKNGQSVNFKKLIYKRIKNNKKLPFSDSFPTIEITKKNKSNFFISLTLGISVPKIKETLLFLTIDSFGNIRQITSEEKRTIHIEKIVNEMKNLNYQINMMTEIKESNKIIFIGYFLSDNKTVDDIVVIFDLYKNEIEKIIDLKEILDKNRSILFKDDKNKRDWLHPNSMFYDDKDKTILFSSRHQGVFKIDLNGKLKWILSPHKYWNKQYNKYLLSAVDSENKLLAKDVQSGEDNYLTETDSFEWSWGQHSAKILSNGDILLFDNGFLRNFLYNSLYSRAVIYRVNEESKTVRQIWQYGKELQERFFSFARSSACFGLDKNECFITSGLIIYDEGKKSMGILKLINFVTDEIPFEANVFLKNKYRDNNNFDSYYDVIAEAFIFTIN